MDIVSAEPLFASIHKFDSGSRWPSFTVALEPGNVAEMADRKLGMLRTEVRSSHGKSHLGHVFDDGPPENGGLRYCINFGRLALRALRRARGPGLLTVQSDLRPSQDDEGKR